MFSTVLVVFLVGFCVVLVVLVTVQWVRRGDQDQARALATGRDSRTVRVWPVTITRIGRPSRCHREH